MCGMKYRYSCDAAQNINNVWQLRVYEYTVCYVTITSYEYHYLEARCSDFVVDIVHLRSNRTANKHLKKASSDRAMPRYRSFRQVGQVPCSHTKGCF